MVSSFGYSLTLNMEGYGLPKRRTLSELYGVAAQKIALFIVIPMRTSNFTTDMSFFPFVVTE
jgi:hypothetical protein